MTRLDDDLRLEGEPEKEFIPGIAATFARKRVAAGALFRDGGGRVLLLEPVYKDTWLLPGGVVEEDEDPLAGCRREVREELGLALPIGGLLVVDWAPRHGVWGDSLQFVFDGGELAPGRLTDLALAPEEIRSARFHTLQEAGALVPPSLHRRLAAAREAAETGVPRYLTFGRAGSATRD